jgi:hypothetical protein
MSATRWLFLVGLVLLLAAGVAGWAHVAAAAETPPLVTGTAAAPPPAAAQILNPIVSVVVGESVTEYEQDPFETTRLRKSATRVRTLVYIHADGTTETRQLQ